jgi:predicted phosphodiesterase
MKIQILSDTHTFDYDIADEAEVVVHAGDFSNNLRGCLEFVDVCKSLNKQPLFVLGNHDYYGSVLNDAIDFN